ncbi:MAG: amylo-alpha-1,6-glucosidase [Desulfotomaculales bacterium]
MDELRIVPRDVQAATEVLKEGKLFLTTLPNGEIPDGNMGGLGLYYRDTRYLSCLEHFMAGTKPVLLSSSTRSSHFSQIELTNMEFKTAAGCVVPLQSIHMRLLRVLQASFYQRVRLINYNLFPMELCLGVALGADYRDIFEVRGTERRNRGEMLFPLKRKNGFVLRYRGLDGVIRATLFLFEPRPDQVRLGKERVYVEFSLFLPPQRKVYLTWRVLPLLNPDERQLMEEKDGDQVLTALFTARAVDQAKSYRQWQKECTKFQSDNEIYNRILEVGITDLRSLYTSYPEGKIIEAGVPWYAAPFGRDALIASWQTLVVNPDIARESLRFLKHYQGKKIDETREEEPGKILHELRRGEMAACKEVLHTPYYGSVDATLWFVILIGAYYNWTGDHAFLEEMWDALERALAWCRTYGDFDGDGFIEYRGKTEGGLTNQGWKDSWNAVIDREGRLATPPIALVEVQAYWYLALKHAERLYRVMGAGGEALRLAQEAEELARRFRAHFWDSEAECLGFALDGHKRLITTVVSNMGQCLFTGILAPADATRVVHRLFQPDMYSGWGIRTMSKLEKAYNPMSYHNGSVWPHDNAIIATGLRRYDMTSYLDELVTGLFEASLHFPYYRLPELFCGFVRRPIGGPVRYPIACDPQAWAVGSVFQMLQAMLGLACDDEGLQVRRPVLPRWIKELYISNMRVKGGAVDLEFTRSRGRTCCYLVRKEGDFRVTIEI